MFVGVNDNQPLAQFKAREEPTVSKAEVDMRRVTLYQLNCARDEAGQPFELLRAGLTKIHRNMVPERMAFPTAGSPHPFCPEHTYTPVASPVRQPARKIAKPLPSYLRVVA
ncbi:hypothetical protein FV222_00325 [Methylobacterium sp. WL103]|uniref:hypothetical protein n=1 Tax=Methylobacterium sp. WL103 TaxID=2603891 RepID=UPI0011CB4AB9|nr:hypothetical protein [Methylobacterium sp. WL103]TXN08950.1 hypothetical protein FV222_00325 [Methylobacterium sp. WL103]